VSSDITDKISKILANFKPITVNIHLDTSRNIKTEKYVENSGNFSVIARPNVDKEEIKKVDQTLFEKESDGFVNVELLQQTASTAALFYSKGQLIRTYKGFLKEKELSAMLISYNRCRLEDNKRDSESSQLKTSMYKAYPLIGSTIYNYVRSGLFETEIKRRLQEIKRRKKSPLDNYKQFREYFEDLLKIHPNRIYVKMVWGIDDVLYEMEKRLNLFRKDPSIEKSIMLHSRSSRNEIAERVSKLDIVQESFTVTIESYKFGKELARTIHFKLK